MADTKAILSSDKSAAPSAALSLLCALIAVQLTLGARGLWKDHGKEAEAVPSAAGTVILAPPSAPSGSLAPLVIPPLPIFANPMPSANTAPSPLSFANPMPPQVAGQPVRSLPGIALALPRGSQAPAAPEASPPQSPATGAAPLEKTGNAEADDLLDVAAQSLELGDETGAIEVLNRADLLLPNNPVIMRQKALALQRQGLPPQNQAPAPVGQPAASLPPPAPLPWQGVARPPSPADILNRSFGSRRSVAPSPASPLPAARPPGPLSIGPCKIVRDPSLVRGERFSLKVPLTAAPGEVIDPKQMTLDVMFYDKVNDQSIELTMADKPESAYDTTGDFRSGSEVISVRYNLPEFTPAQIAELGRHVFYGYVVKLYYKNHLMGTMANPPELSTMGDRGTSPLGTANATGPAKRN